MFSKQFRMMNVLILLLGLVAYQAALAARPVKVNAANPSEAEQGTSGLVVTISGSGFDTTPGAVTEVSFLLPCATEPCSDTGGVEVAVFSVTSSSEIVATIAVADDAVVDYRDIQIRMTRGRGGKGTTLFNVREKATGGPVYITCSDEYFDGVTGICTDVNGGECDLVVGNTPRIKQMTEDCITRATIVLPDEGALNTDGNVANAQENRTLTAAGPFAGDAVITNGGHSATVRGLNIVVGADVTTAVDCDGNTAGDLATGIRFVLDQDTPEPDRPSGSLLYVNAVNISTDSGPLCDAIEVARRDTYQNFFDDWKIYVTGNTIQPFSYQRAGIRFEGFKQQQDINPLSVDNNVVGAPDCSDSGVGIAYGPLNARYSVSASEALIENNTVVMQGATCADTTGIRLLGNGDTDVMGNVNGNSVAGGRIGVEIEVNASTDSINMKGNTLSGDGGDAGVCANIVVGEKGKPNQISGYDLDFDTPPCDGL